MENCENCDLPVIYQLCVLFAANMSLIGYFSSFFYLDRNEYRPGDLKFYTEIFRVYKILQNNLSLLEKHVAKTAQLHLLKWGVYVWRGTVKMSTYQKQRRMNLEYMTQKVSIKSFILLRLLSYEIYDNMYF